MKDLIAHEIRLLNLLFMKSAGRELERRLRSADIAINPLGLGVLRMMQRRTVTLGELSKKMLLTPATLVPVVYTLEKNGFVARRRDSRDRRRNHLYVTRKGEGTLKQIIHMEKRDLIIEKIGGLGKKDKNELRRILRKLVGAIIGGKKIKEIFESFSFVKK